ncbi:putative neck protein, type 1 [Halobacterium phage phiH]|uniref:Putative neck protein, type 1 n=1 Tax=Halobacterium phage phiH TaxID=169684 RepID=A0A3G1ZKR0_BPPHH|nr:tail completion or Neck1 protein [Halobacterium phage phiH]AYM00261.1 putative neck protein, type 1 [Halobacterium phage phiH]
MVEDNNNLPEAKEALETGLTDGIEKLHRLCLRRLVRNMSDGKDALGNPWEPLKASTIRAKGSDTPLIDDSRLITNINVASEMNRKTKTSVIGTNLDYAKHHEYGAPEAGIPRRPIFGPVARLADKKASEVLGEEIALKLDEAEV